MEWKEVRLGDVCDIKHGFAYKGKYFSDTPTCDILVTPGNFTLSGGFKLDKPKYYNGPVEKDFILSKDDLIVTMTDLSKNIDTLGFSALVPEVKGLTFHHNQRIGLVENIANNVDKYFLYWIMRTPAYQSFIATHSSGTTVHHTSPKGIGNYVFRLPPLSDQRRIASILSSLDRKIELNNKINADLEEMAQAIFKNWFVDFEPFKDGKFVDSELGMIPEGWKVGSYSEMIESLISGDWGKENPQGNYTHEVACVRGCDFQDINNGVRGKTPQRYILEKNYQAKHLKDKDILVEISGGTATVSTGRTSLVTEELLKKYKHDIVCTNFCKVLRPLSQFSSYVYYSWKYKYDNDIMFGYENGTSGIKNFAIKDFIEKEPVLIPKEQDIVGFQKIIDSLQKQKQIKGTENTTLSTLRDTLLPRLMSGEIEVPE